MSTILTVTGPMLKSSGSRSLFGLLVEQGTTRLAVDDVATDAGRLPARRRSVAGPVVVRHDLDVVHYAAIGIGLLSAFLVGVEILGLV